MNNLEINDRIAKLCGWTIRDETLGWKKLYISPTGRVEGDPPFYTDSLDLCHEFEKDSKLGYIYNLMTILLSTDARRDCSVEGYSELDLRALLLATPLQRCEAFLRLNNQWE